MSLQTLTRGRRLLSGATVAALTAGALAIAPTTAHAADAITPTFQWKVSEQFVQRMPERTFAGGASESADNVISFPGGTTSYDAATGVAEVDYAGSVTAAFTNGGTRYYEVTIANPSVEVAADGSGKITADVSSEQFEDFMGVPAGSATGPSRVTVTNFSADATTFGTAAGNTTISGSPRWADVLAPGSEAAIDLGLPAGQPVEGKSFDPQFVGAVLSTIRSHFYATNASSDPKTPAAFTATIAPAHAPAAKNVSTRYAKGGTMSVTAPLAGRVTVAGLGTKNAAAGQTVRFALPRMLKAGTHRYAVTFTPSAANLSASTTTATVKIAKVAAAKAKFKLNKKPTRKAKGKATVRVKGVAGGAATTGKVRLKLTKGKKSRFVNVSLVKGKRTVKLPKLAKGKWTVRATYFGNVNYTKRGYVKVGAFKVTK